MIYLDHAATSPMLPEVVEAMAPWLGVPANPASAHRAGQRAAAALQRAREQVAALLQRPVEGIVFTSGATEANHQAIRGLVALGAARVAASALEHPCVHGAIEASGSQRLQLPVDAAGRTLLEGIDDTIELLCLAAVNHETGVIQPVAAAVALAEQRGLWLHVDAAQGLGKGLSQPLAQATTVAASAHKLGGPVGIGALSLRSGEPFPALLTGGAQERGRRAGTVSVAAAVGFGAAAVAALAEAGARRARWEHLAQLLRRGLVGLGGRLVGLGAERVPTHTCVVFDGVPGEALVQALDLQEIAVSSGAACASGSLEPSPVLVAMGDPHPEGALRVSLGPHSTRAEVERLLQVLPSVLQGVRLALELERG